MRLNNPLFSDSPPYTIFLVPGIEVDDLSSPTNIILANVSLLTSGTYKCEMSEGPPRWETLPILLLISNSVPATDILINLQIFRFQTDERLTEVQVVGEKAKIIFWFY